MSEPTVVKDKPSYSGRMGLDKARTQKWIFLIMAVVPPFGGYLLFTLFPNVLSVYYALLDWDGLTDSKFVGLSNFVTAIQDEYVWRALKHNLIFMATVPALVVLISLLLAYLVTYKSYVENEFLKILFFFPNVLSIVVVALLWAFIYDGTYGLLNSGLKLLGIDMNHFYWLGNDSTALWALIPPWVWGGVGLYVIIFVNAMSGIPKSLYESAILEGAGHMTRLFKITLPLILPVVRVSALFLVISTLKTFELILIMTNGGPSGSTDVIGLYMFNLAFGTEYINYGYASAVGMILFVILITAKLLLDKFLPNRGVEY
ncbi:MULTISPECIES: carbohydrate ABC transporter permease [unclassified Paenibacillus]|uniref:carbohydrate ABC transporter permease n=1 Tax=unclassified Paenibacillus TaxID=185978 RepID=UPI00278938A2|nr:MULTISPECIES: sugar ABC transporter permease [unclassified Paenibacillus]MDQ0897780.1 N-acetylglucosamine transport system permease protein [Paenibacillus sp. V4I7]MDQ0916227.1 N-acetylglucosamine transport system permease protein [Paenibacillus sp. V4I5]